MTIKLETVDYQALLLLLCGKRPAWDGQSLKRCVDSGFVTPTGMFLTRNGEIKALALRNAVKNLQRGIPIEGRAINRADDVMQLPWLRTEIDKEAWSICPTAAIRGRLTANTQSPMSLASDLRGELYGHKAATHMKIAPYAVQIDALGHGEFICFHGVTDPEITRRIQSSFFDYMMKTFTSPTFWARDGSEIIIVKRGMMNKSSKFGGIIAVIQGVQLDRPFPPRSNCYGVAEKNKHVPLHQQAGLGRDHSEE